MEHEMSQSRKPSRRKWPTLRISLREVHILPATGNWRLDLPKPIGIPDRAYRVILNHDICRNPFIRRPEEAREKLLTSITAIGDPTWQHFTDPLLWVLRTRWTIRAASLSLAALQSGEELSRTAALPPWPATTQTTAFRTLAAWAGRCRPTQWEDNPLRGLILRQIEACDIDWLPVSLVQASVPEARHRVLWAAIARGATREEAWNYLGRTKLLGDRWVPLSARPVDEKNLHPGIFESWWEDVVRATRTAVEEKEARGALYGEIHGVLRTAMEATS